MNSEDLLTELFPFKKPLTSRYRKKYVEVLALSVLQYCYGDIYAGFDVHDAPDISDENRLIGIEVTEAVTKEEAQIEGEFVKYRLESSLEEKERRKQIIENNGAKVDELGLTYPVKNSDSEKLIFQDAVRKKMEKLASYRRQGFEKVGLFVLLIMLLLLTLLHIAVCYSHFSQYVVPEYYLAKYYTLLSHRNIQNK